MCCSLSTSTRVWSENWHLQMRKESLNLEVSGESRPLLSRAANPPRSPPPPPLGSVRWPPPTTTTTPTHTPTRLRSVPPPQRSQASREPKAPARKSSRAGLDRSRCSKGCRLLALHPVPHVFPLLFFNLIPCVEISGKKIAKARIATCP